MNPNTKRFVFYTVLGCVAFTLWFLVRNGPLQTQATYSRFLEQVEAGEVNSATVVAANNAGANQVMYRLNNGSQLKTTVPRDYRDALAAMQGKMVNIEIRDASVQWLRILANSTPFLVLLGFWVFMMLRLKQRPQTL